MSDEVKNIRSMYRRVIPDEFPDEIEIRFGNQSLFYKKRTWMIKDPETG
ncbi:MAG: IMP cyclohydrolase, partial [Deltaproteobacteria bacterium]